MDSYILTVNRGKQPPTHPGHFYIPDGQEIGEQINFRATPVRTNLLTFITGTKSCTQL